MTARIRTAKSSRRRDYTFLVERLIPRRLLSARQDAALTRALALGERASLFSASATALRELVDQGLYVEMASQDPRRLVFQSTLTRDRVHLMAPAPELQSSRPTPGTVSQTQPTTQPRITATPAPERATTRNTAAAVGTLRPSEEQREVVAHGERSPRAAPQPARHEGAAKHAKAQAPGAQAASTQDTLAALARLEPALQLVAIEAQLAHLAERLRRILAQVESVLPGARVRLWHLEGVGNTEELGNGPVRVLAQANLESTPHLREALRTNAVRYATREPRAPQRGAGAVAAAVPLRVGGKPWGILEIHWESGTLQSTAAFAPLLQPLARLVELAIRNQTTIEKLVFVDPLTGVYNRAFYERQLTLEMERAHRTNRKFALLVMDVDDFKSINDRFGHRAGDTVLANIAHEILSRMRKIDLLFRYGGEEFVLLLPGADQQEARRTAERLRAVVSDKRFAVDGTREPLRVTVSVGVAIYPDDSRTQSGLFKHADAAMYRAKEQGKNRVAYG